MKYLIAGAAALLIAVAIPQTVDAAVFAGHLEMTNNGNGTFELSYRLNEDANEGVTINIKGPAPAETVVRSLSFASQSKGLHTVQWDGLNTESAPVADGSYSWEVVASANVGGSGWVQTGFGTEVEHTFYTPYGMDTDNTTTSPHFGTVYVSNRGGVVAETSRATTSGIYILSNDLADFTNQGDTAYGGDVSWAPSASPFRVHVAPDSDVFISDWSDTNSGVWIMDPDDPNATFAEIFDNSSRSTAGLTVNHGSISSVHVEGVGENRVMYVYEEDYGATTEQLGSIWAHAIGETESGYTAEPTIEYDDAENGNLVSIAYHSKIVKDTNPNRDGWFITQYRWTDTAGSPNVFHYNGTEVDWVSATDLPDQELGALALQGGIDLNGDGTLMVAAGFSFIKVLDISDLQNAATIFTSGGVFDSHREVVFDAAENILATSSNTENLIYYSKAGENTFTTPNPVGAALIVGASPVEGWELY